MFYNDEQNKPRNTQPPGNDKNVLENVPVPDKLVIVSIRRKLLREYWLSYWQRFWIFKSLRCLDLILYDILVRFPRYRPTQYCRTRIVPVHTQSRLCTGTRIKAFLSHTCSGLKPSLKFRITINCYYVLIIVAIKRSNNSVSFVQIII